MSGGWDGYCQAEKRSFADWEQQTAVDRSVGHFFQSLYQVDPKQPVGGNASSSLVSTRAPDLQMDCGSGHASTLAEHFRVNLYVLPHENPNPHSRTLGCMSVYDERCGMKLLSPYTVA